MKIGRFIITLLIGGLIGGCIALFIDYNHSFHFFEIIIMLRIQMSF